MPAHGTDGEGGNHRTSHPVLPSRGVQAAFALSVQHLQYSRFQSGEALAGKVAAGWLYSSMGNTGKSKIQEFINAMLGLEKKGLFFGGVSTYPAISTRLTQQAGMSLQLDEIVTSVAGPNGKTKENSSFIKDMAHSCYDGRSRAALATANATGQTNPLSSWIGSANLLVNEKDGVMWQRVLLLTFDPLIAGDPSQSKRLQVEMNNAKKVISCLLPDMYSLLVKGKLHAAALSDCCDFVNQACGSAMARDADMWGYELYYMLLLEAMAQGGEDGMTEVFDYVCNLSIKQSAIAQKSASTFDQFLIAMHRVVDQCATNPLVVEERSMHWHNYRTTIRPDLACVQREAGKKNMGADVRYIAIRLDPVCNVINKVLGYNFQATEIRRAVENVKYAAFGRGLFYNCRLNPYPIVTRRVTEQCEVEMTALPEDELLTASLVQDRCLFIKMADYLRLIDEVEGVARNNPDYKKILIQSADTDFNDGQPYNFYESVTRADPLAPAWFGYEATAYTKFAPYCGTTNRAQGLYDGEYFDADIEAAHTVGGFPSVANSLTPSGIAKQFTDRAGHPLRKPPEGMPPCFTRNCFVFDNLPGMTPMPPPDNGGRPVTEAGDSDPPTPPRGRSRRPLAAVSPNTRGGAVHGDVDECLDDTAMADAEVCASTTSRARTELIACTPTCFFVRTRRNRRTRTTTVSSTTGPTTPTASTRRTSASRTSSTTDPARAVSPRASSATSRRLHAP